jgi:hypothetical protein
MLLHTIENKWWFLGFIFLFFLSLILPAFIFKPGDDQYKSRKDACDFVSSSLVGCASTVRPDYGRCHEANNGIHRRPIKCIIFAIDSKSYECEDSMNILSQNNFGDKKEVLRFCETLPQTIVHNPSKSGFWILTMGWLGIFGGMIAWYANIFGLVAFIASTKKKYKTGFINSIIAFMLGLQSFNFHTLYQNEGGVNNLIVDHLGIGFYVWEASFAILVLFCLLNILYKRI